jgi:acetyl-CoA carboxylase carboxyl transferase subunit beta
MSWLTQFIRPKIRSLTKKQDIPDHLWNKCVGCSQMIFHKDLMDHLSVCRHCGYHMQWAPSERLRHLFDEGAYQTLSTPVVAADPIHFKDQKRYIDRLKDARQKTSLVDAIILAYGKIHQAPVVVACFDFSFIGGSMGMAVGEAILQAASYAIEKKSAFLAIPSSGGARMQEGIFSLMQMPRSVVAMRMLKETGLPTIMMLAHPTTGGVAASFASLGDVTLAEPGAIIGFAGARVIQDTLRQPLPAGFQTAEFQKDHGFIDLVVSRHDTKKVIGNILSVLLPRSV